LEFPPFQIRGFSLSIILHKGIPTHINYTEKDGGKTDEHFSRCPIRYTAIH
jgi:hypothetical protein